LLLMNCFTLCSTYIATNFFKNIQSLKYSFACNKKLIHGQLHGLAKENDMSLWSHMKLGQFKEFSKKIERSLKASKSVLQEGAQHMGSVVNGVKEVFDICENAFGSHKRICVDQMDALFDYNENKTSPLSPSSTGILDAYKPCADMSNFPSPCSNMPDIFSNLDLDIVEKSEEMIKNKFDKLASQFRFEIKTSKRANPELRVSGGGLLDASRDLLDKYFEQLEHLNSLGSITKFTFSISIIFVLFSAVNYMRRYSKRDYYQNYVFGPKFYELDEKRRSRNQPSVLPLNEYLKDKFVGLFDGYLTDKEIDLTFKSLGVLVLALTPLYFLILADKLLADFVDYIKINTKLEMETQSSNTPRSDLFGSAKVTGSPFLTNVYSQIFKSFSKGNTNIESKENQFFSNSKCLPQVFPPHYDIYKRIGVYTVILVFFTAFQAYVKRWRSIFAGCVYPNRDLERSVWLYNHILAFNTNLGLIKRKGNDLSESDSKRKRCLNFLKTALYNILNFFYTVFMFCSFYYVFCLIPRLSLKSIYFNTKAYFLFTAMKFRKTSQEFCSGCTLQADENNDEGFIKCSNEACGCIYCDECYSELKNRCKACKFEIVQDSDDESLEEDSSDDDTDNLRANSSEICHLISSSNEEVRSFDEEKNERASQESIKLIVQVESKDESSNANYFLKSRMNKKDFKFLDKKLEYSYQNAKKSWATYINEFDSNDSYRNDGSEMIEIKIIEENNAHAWAKFKTELIHYDLERAQKLINSSFRVFYPKIEYLTDHKLFKSILKTSLLIINIFTQTDEEKDREMFEDLSRFVVKNYICNLKLNDYFDEHELHKSSFYEYLRNNDFK
jgi:hypothetical protein